MEIPFTRPYFRGDEGAAVAEVDRLGLGLPGPARARVRGGVRRACRRRRRRRDDQLHDGAAARAVRLRRRPGRRGRSSRRCRSSRPRTPSGRTARTPVFADVDPRTGNIDAADGRARHHRPHARRSCRCTSSGCRPTWIRSSSLRGAAGSRSSRTPRARSEPRYRSRPIGSLGPLACFSLHPRKVITTGEGGMIAVAGPGDRRPAAHSCASTRWTCRTWPATRARDVVIESYPERGWNARMTDMQAALGLTPARAARRDPRGATATG